MSGLGPRQSVERSAPFLENKILTLIHFTGLILWGQTLFVSEMFNAIFVLKGNKESFDVTTLPEGRGFGWNPVRISV